MSKKKILLSVIIPAYNVQDYICKCIDSLMRQNTKDTEIIIIDDGSVDDTPSICDEYANVYDNVFVYHIKNGGQARARNIGIKKSVGEYIMFIDSDDYLADSSFFKKVKNCIMKKPDMIMYGYQKYWEGTQQYVPKKFLPEDYLKKDNLLFYLIQENYFKGCPWDKIVRSDIIRENKIMFPNGKLSEDIDWCAQLLNCIDFKNIQIINENSYVYVQHAGSTSKKVKKSHIIDILDIFDRYLQRDCNDIMYYYFAYEYCMILGVIFSHYVEDVPSSVKKRFYSYRFLLKYHCCKKVKLCYTIYRIFGIKICAKILGIFVNIKKRGI